MNDPHPSQLMFKMITGYWVTQLVGAFAELGVADALAGGPRTTRELAERVGVDAGALERALRAAASVGVVRLETDRWATTPLGDTLRSGTKGSLRDMAIAQSAEGHWLPWGRFREALRTGTRQTLGALGAEIWDHYAKHPSEGRAFSGAMRDLSALVAGEVASTLRLEGAKRVVDVGGANGTLLAAVLGANPSATGVLLDLPHVAEGGRAALDQTPVASRCEVVGGDFFDRVPDGDVYLLKQVLHDWDDDKCGVILRNCARGLGRGGRVAIVEMIVPDDLRPSPAQLMDLNMLVMLTGRERTRAEYDTLLGAAGLRIEHVHETHSPFQIIEAVAS